MNFFILQDWDANRGNPKGRIFLVFFRFGQVLKRSRQPFRKLFFPYFILYELVGAWLMGIEVPLSVEAGPSLRIFHGQGLVLHGNVRIGAHCDLKQSTTIGISSKSQKAPRIGDHVNIGSSSVIIGDISIGNNVVIGAGSIVTKDIPSDCVIVGNPARILRRLTPSGADASGTAASGATIPPGQGMAGEISLSDA